MPIELYSLASTPTPGEYIIQKFDTDYRCESVYAMTETTCMCPQGHKPDCRHRKMLRDFLRHGHVSDGWFLEWQTRLWRKPVGDMALIAEEAIHAVTEDQVSRPSVGEGVSSHSPSPGDEGSAPSPPSPPEGSTSLSAEAAMASPVGAVATIKRRKV